MFNIKLLKKEAENLTVLYVEDDININKSVATYLRKLFKTVTAKFNGLEALESYKIGTYDLVITDINMPIMDGLTMSKKIKELNSEQNILITSAYSDSSKFIASIKIGIDGYIIKPINYDEFNTILIKTTTKINKFKDNELYSTELENLIEMKTSENSKLELDKINNYEKTLFSLVEMIETRDPYTGQHSHRVAKYSKMIAEQMAYSQVECEEIYKAGILHDIGKISIPDTILLNPNKLTNSEYHLIKNHVQIGYEFISKIPLFKNIAEIMYSHHERLDGSGYPNNLKEDEISIKSNIIAVADTFDAISTNRIYQKSRSVQEALQEIKSLSGIHFREQIVDAAQIILKDIEIKFNTSQLPQSKFEEQRFSYFYKDNLTQLYNDSYLDLILKDKTSKIEYTKIYLISLNNFGAYNREYSWYKGNELLVKIANFFIQTFKDSLIFRIYGDDFILLNKNNFIPKDKIHELNNILKSHYSKLTYTLRIMDIKEKNINSAFEIEKLIFN
ncbi:HD domain-containing phosphohydrolase [Poseidonibacter lekithochrous]|uniref:HD domain-containing phosphohydrolase n=1 Tax=Poseidonibacter lekithochrous TaxID=1904463 RepID=UPI0008FC2A84|nr:HD domain-containing phosphohydrolase [Poseidonibacter lekithochrous]QKJ23311.1 response regulator c-di-GMP phosphodiesterase, RpfG family (diguanylate cyclase domain) [Poseidonibacter lekithochrous]